MQGVQGHGQLRQLGLEDLDGLDDLDGFARCWFASPRSPPPSPWNPVTPCLTLPADTSDNFETRERQQDTDPVKTDRDERFHRNRRQTNMHVIIQLRAEQVSETEDQ